MENNTELTPHEKWLAATPKEKRKTCIKYEVLKQRIYESKEDYL